MLPTFVVHYDKLTERKKNIQRVFNFARFITEPQISKVEDADLSFYTYLIGKSKELWKERTTGLYPEEIPYRELKTGDISCFLKHMKALEFAMDYEHSLILEDDAIIDHNIWNCLYDLLRLKDYRYWDVLFIGGAFDHNIAKTLYEVNDNIIVKDHPATNTVCSYIVKRHTAIAITKEIFQNGYVLPIDFEYNYIFKKLNLKVGHYVPYPIKEGSSTGFYKGTQER